MQFLNKIFKTKEKNNSKIYTIDLERQLNENHIPYDIEELNERIVLSYINPFNDIIYRFDYIEGLFYLNEKKISDSEVFRLIKEKWKTDEWIIKYMEDERYYDFFDIVDFFDNIISTNGLINEIIPLKNKDGLQLYYNIGSAPTKKEYVVGIELNTSKDEKQNLLILPNKISTDANGAILTILKKIYDEAPLFFNSGAYVVKPDSRFTDITKTYLIDLAMTERLNDIDDIEAQITDVGKNNNIFVMFKNGSALEYISPTKQTPTGKLLIIDFDADNTAEENESYSLVSKILKLSSMIKDKPDENKMPKRDFSNKKLKGRIK